MTDVIGALVTFLNTGDVNTLTGGRVYGGDLDEAEVPNMPRAALVVAYAGGGTLGVGANSYLRVGEIRVDLRCYGETPYEADRIHRAAHGLMKHMRRDVVSSVLLHHAVNSGGPLQLRDPKTDWPFVLRTYMVTAAETAVS